MRSIETTWRFVASSLDGQSLLLDGLDVWKYKWLETGERVTVTDPKYHQEFCFSVFEIQVEARTLRFAGGEYSNCIWGFYLPE